jgi:tRNA-specific 2-thiouridylase
MASVVLAMSGGVDSSVAAKLLQQRGHAVVGVFMRHGEDASCGTNSLPIVSTRLGRHQGCCTAVDAEDARRVADQLDIPFYAVDFRDDFRRITDYFVAEYSAGRTPNPCVVCNHWIKFGRLFEYADSLGADYVATGHYARIARSPRGPGICRGADPDKDQSYVLFGIATDRLARILLPVGDYHKPEIRRIAAKLGLRVAQKKDSQEICFVAAGQHADFVAARRSRDTQGEIVDSRGTVLGHHTGIERFTVGQRRGLGIALGEPAYVVRIEADTCRVVVGSRDDLLCRTLIATNANWLVTSGLASFRALVQIRYNSPASPALVTRREGARFEVQFDAPIAGVAPGQAAVCYDDDRVLGGGWIEDTQ